jgi:tetratricopeptide (TPR) repeat protein
MEGADQKRWWDRLEVEHDNLRVALTRSATDPTGPHELLRFAGMLGRFWQIRGYLHEGIGWLEMALARTEVTPSAARARVLNWLGQLEAINGNLGRACPAFEESIAQARAVGDRRVLSLALRHLGLAVLSIGDYALSRQLIDEALAVSREAGYKREIAWNLQALGQNLSDAGQREGVAPLLHEGIAVGRESGDVTPVLASMWTLGRLYALEGEFQRARQQLHDALRLTRQIDYKVLIPGLLVTLGDLASAERDWETAVDFYCQGLRGANLMAARGAVAHALRHYAAMCGARGDHRGAVRIFSALSTVTDSPGTTMVMASLRTGQEADVVAAARWALGDEDFAAACAEGRSITLEQVTAEVLRNERD